MNAERWSKREHPKDEKQAGKQYQLLQCGGRKSERREQISSGIEGTGEAGPKRKGPESGSESRGTGEHQSVEKERTNCKTENRNRLKRNQTPQGGGSARTKDQTAASTKAMVRTGGRGGGGESYTKERGKPDSRRGNGEDDEAGAYRSSRRSVTGPTTELQQQKSKQKAEEDAVRATGVRVVVEGDAGKQTKAEARQAGRGTGGAGTKETAEKHHRLGKWQRGLKGSTSECKQ